ncbi:hypothetical protein TrLO_g12969 [Triparma laevis f. longispina]|uniref:protein disulfide-isomerase n=1 Tax=Triparma laevis f. longispina TaxID=1714387 RepID=A0A9W7FI57_9STRA|nr:hypothetical protein TrLO_g12969 [Triparma laevis f. longispina]
MQSIRNLLLPLLLLQTLVTLSRSSEEEITHIYLSDSNFTSVASSSSSPLFVFYYAPWCGHCAKFHPVFDEFASSYASSGASSSTDVTFVKVDAEHPDSSQLANKYSINSFPTIHYYPPHSTPSTKPITFNGPDKTPDSLTIFIDQSRVGPNFLPLDASNSYASNSIFDRSDLILTLKSSSKKTLKKIQALIASFQSDEIVKSYNPIFYHAETSSDLGPNCETDCLEIWNKRENKRVVVTEFDDADLFRTILKESIKPYVVYTQGFFSRCQTSSKMKKFVVIFEKEFKITDEFKSLDFGNDAVPVWVDVVEFKEVAEMYRIIDEKAGSVLPEVLLIDVSGNHGTQVTKIVGGPINPLELNKVVSTCLITESESCTAKPRARSDLAKKIYSQEKPIQRLVGKTIKRNILTSTIDQFVYFYNEGDSDWRAMREQYASIAARFQIEETLEFLEIDLEKNDIPLKEVEILSTPVLYLFPSNAKTEPIRFGKRGIEFSNEEILKFLKKHVTLPFRGSFDGQHYVGVVGRTKYQVKIYKQSDSFKSWWKQFWEKKLTVMERMEIEEAEEEAKKKLKEEEKKEL